MPRTYVELQVTTSPELIEQLIGILSQIGFEGFWEDGSDLRCYMNKDRWTPALHDEVRVVIAQMHHSSSYPRPDVIVRTIEDRNWNEEWEKTIRPIHITDRIVIKPTWHAYEPAAGELVITIDPKMSFGTGYHESTRLVLILMEKHLRAGSRLLDIGTGTGVLAIAGVLLGAASAVAVDVDEWSYNNSVENARLNHVEGKLRIIHGDLAAVPLGCFDLIVANIQLNVIVSMLPELKHRLASGGLMLLSGLLTTDRDEILQRLGDCEFGVLEEMTENEWMAVVCDEIIRKQSTDAASGI